MPRANTRSENQNQRGTAGPVVDGMGQLSSAKHEERLADPIQGTQFGEERINQVKEKAVLKQEVESRMVAMKTEAD